MLATCCYSVLCTCTVYASDVLLLCCVPARCMWVTCCFPVVYLHGVCEWRAATLLCTCTVYVSDVLLLCFVLLLTHPFWCVAQPSHLFEKERRRAQQSQKQNLHFCCAVLQYLQEAAMPVVAGRKSKIESFAGVCVGVSMCGCGCGWVLSGWVAVCVYVCVFVLVCMCDGGGGVCVCVCECECRRARLHERYIAYRYAVRHLKDSWRIPYRYLANSWPTLDTYWTATWRIHTVNILDTYWTATHSHCQHTRHILDGYTFTLSTY